MKRAIQIVGLSLLVVILPAASWYFLKSGLDYRLESMDKLGDYGKLPQADLILNNGKSMSIDQLEGKMVILHELSDAQDTTLIMELFRQFHKRPDVQFIFTNTELLRLKAERTSNLWLVDGSISNQTFLTQSGIDKEKNKNVVLVDSKGDIRSFYDLSSIEELRQLVEHLAFLLPIHETDKPEMHRESEK